MKRILILLLLLAVASFACADDALVLPQGVLRTYITGAYGSASRTWDENGDKEDLTDPSFGDINYRLINVGGAVEFGVLDWISAAVQWAPGWNVWSKFPDANDPADKATVNGPADIFVGAKIQVVGENAPVANDMFRVAFAPGVKVPLPGPDFSEERTKGFVEDDSWIIQTPDKHVLGLGARAYFDYIINEMLYVNLYSELIYFVQTMKREDVSFGDWVAVNLFAQPNADVDFGYDLTLEAEPQFEMMFGGTRLGVELPITFTMSPELKFDDTEQADTESYLVSVSPAVSLFLTQFVVPTEFKLGYTLPLVGKNEDVRNIIVLQVKSYLKFF
jgi:hypothetical protein